MTIDLLPQPYRPDSDGSPGRGLLVCDEGWLPLRAFTAHATVGDQQASVTIRQSFTNPASDAIEAVYIHPLPDRAAVVGFAVTIGDRRTEGTLRERGEARARYDQALADGHRAAITEEDRPDVFTTRVGNLQPGDVAEVELTLVQPLPWEDGAVIYRLPLVVAPRYVPGRPLDGPSAGGGVADDTDAAPDASRISPPVLLPGVANPVRLDVRVDFGDRLPPGLTSSLHAIAGGDPDAGPGTVRLRPGERLDRDVILRWEAEGPSGDDTGPTATLTATPDEAPVTAPTTSDTGTSDTGTSDTGTSDPTLAGDGTFTFRLTPPAPATAPARPRDVVVVLDRSGSMSGWKIVAARRAAGRILDTLGPADRFTVLAFDNVIERPAHLFHGGDSADGDPGSDGRGATRLVAATDRNRWLALEWLAGLDARGGTELRAPLVEAVTALAGATETGDGSGAGAPTEAAAGPGPTAVDARRATCVVVTDGQLGNEDQILAELGGLLGRARVFTVGIDRSVNAGFLRRLAAVGGGRFELVESEDRLDEAMTAIHRRIADVALEAVTLTADDGQLLDLSPEGPVDCFHGVPLVIRGRYRGDPPAVTWRASAPGRAEASGSPAPRVSVDVAARPLWARARIRDLEDGYAASTWDRSARDDLGDRIVELSLGAGVLSRFTAFVAVDVSERVDSSSPRPVVQPVEVPSGWVRGDPAGSGGSPMRSLAAGGPALMAAPFPAQAPGSAGPGSAAQEMAAPPRSRVAQVSRRILGQRRPTEGSAPNPPSGSGPDGRPIQAHPPVVPQVSLSPELDRYADRLEELISRIDALTDDDPSGAEPGDGGGPGAGGGRDDRAGDRTVLSRQLTELAADLASIGASDEAVAAVARLADDVAASRSATDAIAAARRALADPATDPGRPAPPLVAETRPRAGGDRRRFWR